MFEQEEWGSIEDFDMFCKTEQLCDDIWKTISEWAEFAKASVGKQLINAVDSVCANLIEGDGRYHFRETLHYYSIARGSIKTFCYFLHRAQVRGLLTDEQTDQFLNRAKSVGCWIDTLICGRHQWMVQLRPKTEDVFLERAKADRSRFRE